MRTELSVAAPFSPSNPSFAGLPAPNAGEGVPELPFRRLLLVSALDGSLNEVIHLLDDVCWWLAARIATAGGEGFPSPFAESDGYTGEVRDQERQRGSLSGHEMDRFSRCDLPGREIDNRLAGCFYDVESPDQVAIRAMAATW